MRLPEEIKTQGFFWVPDVLDNKLAGSLLISAQGDVALELLGVFGNRIDSQNDPDIGRIVGIVEGNIFVTLEDCFYTKRNFSLGGGISKSTVCVNIAFLGAGYDKNEPITFSKLRFSVEGLDEWLSISGIQIQNNPETKSCAIHFSLPDEVKYRLSDDVELAFGFIGTFPAWDKLKEVRIKQKAYISISFKSEQPLDGLLVEVDKIRNFIAFALNESVALDAVTGFSQNVTADYGELGVHQQPIEIYYRSRANIGAAPKINFNNLLFSYQEIKVEFERVVAKWDDSYALNQSAFNLYFAAKNNQKGFIDDKFLSLVQALEALHRRTSKTVSMPIGEFEETKKVLLNACPNTQKEWLEGKLKYANEPSLNQRLSEMTEPFEHCFDSPKKRKRFIRKVVATRNYLTHYDITLQQEAAYGEDLFKLCEALEALFQLQLLKLIDFSEELAKRTNNMLLPKLKDLFLEEKKELS